MTSPSEGDDPEQEEPSPVELPLDGELDLHPFRPQDTADVVASYLEACREKGVLLVRIVHGKGTGARKRQVEKQLDQLPFVVTRWAASERDGGWGATFVRLSPPGG